MKQTVEAGGQVIHQPLMGQKVGLESRPFQIAATSQAQPQPRQQQQGNQRKRNTSERRFTKINMSLAQALQHMLEDKLVMLKDPSHNPNTTSPRYNPNSRCAYHSNSPGYDTNNC